MVQTNSCCWFSSLISFKTIHWLIWLHCFYYLQWVRFIWLYLMKFGTFIVKRFNMAFPVENPFFSLRTTLVYFLLVQLKDLESVWYEMCAFLIFDTSVNDIRQWSSQQCSSMIPSMTNIVPRSLPLTSSHRFINHFIQTDMVGKIWAQFNQWTFWTHFHLSQSAICWMVTYYILKL
jgi:hypothetical protein